MTGPDRGGGEHSHGSRDRRERLFEGARGLPEEERSAFLDEQCGDDPELRAELESLLSNATEAEEFMEVLGRVASGPTDAGDVIERLNRALEGRYAVEREIGAGGMATVYLAQDLKHHRPVALKALKPELAAVVGADRFLAEIETTANLQHPHILPLYDSGDADGFLYYVMPYVEGETLRDRLAAQKQLPVEEAVRTATAIADALGFAHTHGVVHRDIKPGNILFQGGQPVVGDFGIALAMGVGGGTRLTETGLSLGTPHYMSPEQATGDQVVGPASDIYSLGCVLYEMLVGDPPYVGSNAQAVLGQIVAGKAVAPTGKRSAVPANVDAAIRKALEKLPADRFDNAADFARALQDAGFRYGTEPAAAGARRWKLAAGIAGVASLVAVVLAVALVWTVLDQPPVAVARYGFAFAPGQEPAGAPTGRDFALSPDGSSIVYVGRAPDRVQLWVKSRHQFEAFPLAGTEGAFAPSVSTDGQWVAYKVTSGGVTRLRKVPLGGGPSVTLADSVAPFGGAPAAWLDDGTLVYIGLYIGGRYTLLRVSGVGGVADTLWIQEPGTPYPYFPKALPGSRGILFGLCDGGCREAHEVWALNLDTGEAHCVVAGAIMAEYLSTGHLVFVRPNGSVWAVPFDLGSLQPNGDPVQVLDRVKVDGRFAPELVLSSNGTLLMRTAAPTSGLAEFVWVTRQGVATPVDSGWTFDPGDIDMGWSLSPDGTRLAARVVTGRGTDVWIKELPDGPFSPLTFTDGDDLRPKWDPPDGALVTFLSDRGGKSEVWSKRADGAGGASLVYAHDRALAEAFWTPDGNWLVVRTEGTPGVPGSNDILAMRADDSVAAPLIAEDYNVWDPTVSPDSRWIAYASARTGRSEVFVSPFPDVGGGLVQVSINGGFSPHWAHSGRELFYVDPSVNGLVVAQVETEPSFRVVERETLFDRGGYLGTYVFRHSYDVTADDSLFLMARATGADFETPIILVENWFEELKAAVGR